MSIWTEEAAKHKAMRRGQIDAPVSRGGRGKKVEKPWRVMFRMFGKERCTHKFATKAEAESWVEKQRRSFYMRRQDQSERAAEEARKLAEKWAARYRIVGPGDIE